MSRRKVQNKTGLSRIEGIPYHDAWVGFICLNCSELNNIRIGDQLLEPMEAYESAVWKCEKCSFVHSKDSDLPFDNWSEEFKSSNSMQAQRFWQGFFRIATEHFESYWKQCNACGRILSFRSFSRHKGWGPLERQMECRGCKGAINAVLNPLRTAEQHHESSVRRRIADLLLEGENEHIDFEELFKRFGGKCFKTGKVLKMSERQTWAIDHILPSKYLFPLSNENAALLSSEANSAKGDQWPSKFYTNNELIALAKITRADLSMLASKTPIINDKIDVNKCVARYLQVREKSDLLKRIRELRKIIASYNLLDQLTPDNKKILGL